MFLDFNKGFGSCFQPGAGYPAVTAEESLRDEEAAAMDQEGSIDAENTLTAEELTGEALEARAEARRMASARASAEIAFESELNRIIKNQVGGSPAQQQPGSWVSTRSPLIK